MVASSWSDPQSVVTTELGEGDVTDAPRRRCEVPKVGLRQHNGSDQQVPVYWDQTVPVWSSCKEARSRISISKRKRKADSLCRHGKSSRLFGGGPGGAGGVTMFVDKTLPGNCCCKDGREHSAGAASEVSFDVIMSMYRGSVVEMLACYEWSRGAALLWKRRKSIAILDDGRRLNWQPLAGSSCCNTNFGSSTRVGHISVLT